ncbi:hypothetical protein AAY473_021172 [Plecturocebus cupreus]
MLIVNVHEKKNRAIDLRFPSKELVLTDFKPESSKVLQWCHGTMLAHCNLCLLNSGNSCASVSQVAGITGMRYHTWLIFVFLVEMGFHHFGQAGLELLPSNDIAISALQSAGIIGVSHRTQPDKQEHQRQRQTEMETKDKGDTDTVNQRETETLKHMREVPSPTRFPFPKGTVYGQPFAFAIAKPSPYQQYSVDVLQPGLALAGPGWRGREKGKERLLQSGSIWTRCRKHQLGQTCLLPITPSFLDRHHNAVHYTGQSRGDMKVGEESSQVSTVRKTHIEETEVKEEWTFCPPTTHPPSIPPVLYPPEDISEVRQEGTQRRTKSVGHAQPQWNVSFPPPPDQSV